MTTEADMGVMAATSPGMLEPPGARRGRKDTSLGPPEGAQPWDTLILDFGPQNCRKINLLL